MEKNNIMDEAVTAVNIHVFKEFCPQITPLELVMPLFAIEKENQDFDNHSLEKAENDLKNTLDEEDMELVSKNRRIYLYFLICLSQERSREDILYRIRKTANGYRKILQKGFSAGEESLLVAFYFAGKPDENLDPLLERLEKIQVFRKDLISSALLASSYYGMEELNMRLPALEAILKNPFGDGKMVELISGSIMIADGGPAEGAKAIQLYLSLEKAGVDVQREGVVRMIGILAILAIKATVLGQQLIERAEKIREAIALKEEFLADEICFNKEISFTDWFLFAAALWIWEQSGFEEAWGQMNLTAVNLLTGMPQEVFIIVAASCLEC